MIDFAIKGYTLATIFLNLDFSDFAIKYQK